MSVYAHSFGVGGFRCAVIADRFDPNTGNDRAQQILQSAPREELEAALEALPDEMKGNSMNCLLINTGEQLILVDTGLGASNGGALLEGLAAMGVATHEIDLVFLTHFHGDHINGLVDENGERVFSSARIMANRAEWEGWDNDELRERLGTEQWEARMKPLAAVKDELTLVEVGDEIVPGITVVGAYGHTPGHVGLMMQHDGGRLLVLVDLLHVAVQFAHPEWSPTFDMQPEISPITRRELLRLAAKDDILTLFYHLPFPGLGRVREADGAFAWEPIR